MVEQCQNDIRRGKQQKLGGGMYSAATLFTTHVTFGHLALNSFCLQWHAVYLTSLYCSMTLVCYVYIISLTLNIPSLAHQCCLPSWGPRRTPWFFCNFSTVWCGRLLKLCFLGFRNYNSVIQALLASNILCLFISTEVTGGTELLHTHSSLIQHVNNVIFWALSAGHFSNLQRSEPKNNKNNNIPHT